MAKQFTVELSAPQKYGSGYYYASLTMPCEDNEVTEALQRARITSVNDAELQLSIYDCSLIPELDNLRLDSPTLDELNLFAKRLDALSEDEQMVLQAVVGKVLPGADDDGDRFVSIESKVGANHGGTVLMRELLDFGETGYIEFDDDTSPNFLGYDLTPSEFSETDFSEDDDTLKHSKK